MSEIVVRSATPADHDLLRNLALACPPLDVHTPYTYWVQTTYFHHQCFVAEHAGSPVGFVTSISNREATLVWQVGVLAHMRGRGIGRALVDAVVAWCKDRGVPGFQVSINPRNAASMALFQAVASALNGGLERVSDVDLHDSSDPDFRELEDLYLLQFGSV